MDAQYPSNAINTSGASYPSPSAVSPHQLHQNSPAPPHTLPPLQPHGSTVMQSMYGSNPHTPRTPATPNTPGSANTMSNYPQPPSQGAGRGAAYAMGAYGAHQGYGTSQPMIPQTTAAPSHQAIAPAPPSGRAPPILRPMPAGGVMTQPLGSPYAPQPLMQPSMADAEQPTHVVGSQGRRGILPSAPGRPAAPIGGSAAAKTNPIPQKNEDGKFPCPHCTKTYLHAKHLKRHLLRHTGDRPYMCVLCRDTFSRSDILKRHFQKCSIRRGNPTGASHLSHPQAHVKKNGPGQKGVGVVGPDGDMNHLNGMGNMPGDGMHHPFGMMPVSDGMNNMANDQNQLSRSSSLTRLDNGGNQDRRSMTSSVMGASSRGGSYEQTYSGDVSSSMNQQMPNYSMPSNQNGMPMYGGSNSNQQPGLEWAQMFQPGAQNPYGSTFSPNIGQTQIGLKQEPNTDAEGTDGLPGGVNPNDSNFFENPWGLPSTLPDPYLHLSNQILNFFYPPGAMITAQSAGMNLYFSSENIKDFLDKYTHFHVHFPLLHTPTFRILEAYTGLLAGMCCIGACYSDRVSASHVREMMDFLREALERECRFLSTAAGYTNDNGPQQACTRRDLEELQAMMMMQSLLTWNGTPQQREHGRQLHPIICRQIRRLGLLEVSKDMSLFSLLHQPDFSPQNFDVSSFDWLVWVEQEKRLRLMYMFFLCDAAQSLYFNLPTQFDSLEVLLPLPSDDATWDAKTSKECADSMGLHGPDAARAVNPDGTQRSKQPEMSLALQALFHSSYQIQPGSTNLYGKFILIHAILSMIRSAQLDGSASHISGYGTPPLSDWMTRGGPDVATQNSGRATPVDGVAQMMPQQSLNVFRTALDKFKKNWDMDMVTQFPPSTPLTKSARRYGFSRDGIHFYWLAKYVLKNTRAAELQMAPDSRFTQMIALLKSVKAWVMSDGASRGEELGSVGDIDKDYGVMDLTLDMADLFTPLPEVVEDPGITSVKTDI